MAGKGVVVHDKVFGGIVAVVGVYYQRRQTKIMETQATADLDRATRQRETGKFLWWKTPAMPALIMLVALAWTPYFLRKGPSPVILGWGGVPGNCNEIINTEALLPYSDKYKVVGICGITDPSVDVMEDERITVSNAFTILPGQIVTHTARQNAPFPLPSDPKALIDVWHKIVLLPSNQNPDQIHKLSDVNRLGGQLL
jgi:hypothetical protein